MGHDVKFSIPERDLDRSDVEFGVWRNGDKIGVLAVSKGSVVWFPKKVSWGYKVGWGEFDSIMWRKERASRSDAKDRTYDRISCYMGRFVINDSHNLEYLA